MKIEKLHLKDKFPFLGDDGKDATLTVYVQDNINGYLEKRPTMLVLPGGGYSGCSSREAEVIGVQFMSLGFNVAVLIYSCSPNRFPTQLREVAASMELLYEKSSEWNIDTKKIAAIGFSAGGHLAAHYSTMYDCKEVREKFPESKPFNATVLSYPVISVEAAHTGSFKNLAGHYPLTEEEIAHFSCEKNVKPTTPPTFIWHTATDGTVPVANSLMYATALTQNKVPFELHVFPEGRHGLATCDYQTCNGGEEYLPHDAKWLDLVKAWLKMTFKL